MGKAENSLQAVANGDRTAFRVLYRLFSERVYNTALSYAQNAEDAEEITQDVFVRIFEKAHSFRGMSKASTWIYRITVNASLNHLQKHRRHLKQQQELKVQKGIDFEHPGVLLEQKERSKWLFKAIESLSDDQKTVFILSYVEGLPQKEVAVIIERSLKAVESLLQRAKQNLRKQLKQSRGLH